MLKLVKISLVIILIHIIYYISISSNYILQSVGLSLIGVIMLAFMWIYCFFDVMDYHIKTKNKEDNDKTTT